MKPKLTPTVIGIDIGSSTAKLAAVERGTIDIITNEANFRETPAIVGYGEGERKIGEMGQNKLKSNFKNSIVSPTRFLGITGNNDYAKEEIAHVSCVTLFQGDRLLFKVDNNGKQQKFSAEQVLASFMNQLSNIILHNNLDDKLIVFSVPAYFNEIEKRAFLNAADICGIRNVKLVTQTVAIGLDYGSFKKSEMGDGKNVVFVDFGHSKLSASLIKFTDTKMQIVMEKAHRNLGCRNIDQKVFGYINKKFEEKKGLNLRQSKRACLKVMEAIQKQRKILSGIAETDISIESLMEDEDLSEPFSRQIMHNEAAEVFTQIKQFLIGFKQQLKRQGINFDSVQLVGGGSRIPKVIEIIQEALEMNTSRTINSSETIARGATLAAVQQSGLFRFHSFHVLNKLPYTVAISKQGQQNIVVMEAGSYIPNERVVNIQIDQESELFIIFEDTGYQGDKNLKKISIEKPAEGQNQLTLIFKFNEDGFVSLVSLKDKQAAEVKFKQTLLNILSTEQIVAFQQKQKQMFLKDFSIVRSYEKKNDLEAFLYKQKQFLEKEDIKKYSKGEQKQKIQKYLNEITEQLGNEQNQMAANQYENKKKQVENQIKKLQQIVNERKAEVLLHFKDLEKVKNTANETIKQIQQRFRSSKPVQQTCQQLQQISNWADDAIKQAKTKEVNELPIVSKEDIDQQNQNIRTLVNNLMNPPKVQYQAPRHQRYEQHYDPEESYAPRYGQRQPQRTWNANQSQYGYNTPTNQQRSRQQPQYYQDYDNQYQPHYFTRQPQQQRRRQPQQQYHDPYGGMTRSGFYGNNFFNNMSGFF